MRIKPLQPASGTEVVPTSDSVRTGVVIRRSQPMAGFRALPEDFHECENMRPNE